LAGNVSVFYCKYKLINTEVVMESIWIEFQKKKTFLVMKSNLWPRKAFALP